MTPRFKSQAEAYAWRGYAEAHVASHTGHARGVGAKAKESAAVADILLLEERLRWGCDVPESAEDSP